MPRLLAYLVEDSAVIRDSLTAALEELTPVRVVGSAEDEDSALHWLGQADHRVDLVIVDLFLKGGSGLGVVRALQTRRPDQKLVVLSHYATPDMRAKCLALGVQRVFDKAGELDALIQYCNTLALRGLNGHAQDGPAPAGEPPLH
jgi:DNA-binding NarL/FixJ family response regulator